MGSSSDHENGVSDLEKLQSRNISDDESRSEGSGGAVTTNPGKKRKRQDADSKVLSHAEKRRQKKRESKVATGLAGEKRAKSGAADVSSRRQNSVWVGNLSFKTTVDDLKTFFARAGDMTRINMPGRKAENQGFAYVDFATPEAKTCAIALSEQPLIGRKLLIKDGDDFTGRPQPGIDSNVTGDKAAANKTYSKTAQKILRAQKQPPGPTLFLGNLGFETTEADILEMLNAHRSPSDKSKPPSSGQSSSWIRKVRMGTFEDSGLCKGFAFVDFMSMEGATSALTNPKNFFLNGRKLVVEYASPDAVRRGAPKGPGKTHRSVGGDESLERPSKRHRVDFANTRSQERGPKPRAKPGASLASAQRESVAIIPSQGKKIRFD